MVDMVGKEDYDLCDRENSNLRRLLLWCANHMTRDERKELAEKLKRPIDEGGVVDDDVEADAKRAEEFFDRVDELCDLCDDACQEISNESREKMIVQASAYANTVRGLLHELRSELAGTLHRVRKLAD